MEISQIEIKKLTAATGMILTNGIAYGKVVYLGKNDKTNNWYEILESEYEKIKKAEEMENERLE